MFQDLQRRFMTSKPGQYSILDSRCWIPDSTPVVPEMGFNNWIPDSFFSRIFKEVDSGVHKQKISWIPESGLPKQRMSVQSQ